MHVHVIHESGEAKFWIEPAVEMARNDGLNTARIAEAVMGVVSLENLVVIGEHFKIWPDDVRVVEIEPGPTTWSAEHSAIITNALETLAQRVREAALDGN